MAGTFARTKLAFAYIASSKADIYTAGASDIGLVHNITIHNTNSSTETVELFYNESGGSELQILDVNVVAGDTVFIDFPNEGFLVESNDKITGNTTTASKVVIKIDGSVET